MTNRERNLLVLFFAVLVAAGVLLALDSYFRTLSGLNAEFISLQQRAVRLAQTSPDRVPADDTASMLLLKKRFYAPGTLPEPLTLAAAAQNTLQAAGLSLVESRITESSAIAHWVKYSVHGDIDAWFRFLKDLRQRDPRTLFRSLSMVKKEGSVYEITFEVGHVVLP